MAEFVLISFRVEQFVAPAANAPLLVQRSEGQNSTNSGGEDNSSALIAGLTISAFVVGMLFAFLICYIHRSRRSTGMDCLCTKTRDSSSTIASFFTPSRRSPATNNLRNPPLQGVIPWEAESYAESRDRVLDLVGPSAPRSRWRQHFSRAKFPISRSAGRRRPSSGSGTVMTESSFESEEPSSPTTLLSPSGMTLSSAFYAPSTMPSVGRSRTRDRQSLLIE